MDRMRINIIVFGKVQGVNYRWATQKEASRLGLTGWVHNLPDGSVKLIAEGQSDGLNALVDWCREGPALAVVHDINLQWEEASCEFGSFDIRY